ncbi:deacetylase [Nitzschia inconspicua]|uniref:Deacetylase n=1 Tax=Nitzschia inconspicua TaxID=303405 RepID=A0A9K3KUH8_9STRA|nr:deacetylase [Nitzschia inconspicua]
MASSINRSKKMPYRLLSLRTSSLMLWLTMQRSSAFHKPVSTILRCPMVEPCPRLGSMSFHSLLSGSDSTLSVPTPQSRHFSMENSYYLESFGLKTSRFGLDPFQNKLACPFVYHEQYSFPEWPENHTFPMDKFARIAHTLKSTTHLVDDTPRLLVRNEEDFFRPLDFDDIPVEEWLCSIIDPDFVHRFLNGMLTTEEARRIGFREQTARPELIQRTVLEVAGTVLTAQLAFHFGVAANLAGGTHHAHPLGGAGYTILNDLAVTANFLTDKRLHDGSTPGINRVLVIDCDVHQGDGTAQFSTLWGDDRLATLSIHCASNYPQDKANSTYDIGLRDKCGDSGYMEILKRCVETALVEVEPDFVLYDGGVDVYEHDKLGRLSLTENGIRLRDRFVVEKCVSLGIPVAAVVIFSALIQRTNQVEQAVQDRNTALQRLRDLKSKELAGYDNVKKEDIQLLLEQYERAVLREEALRNLVPGVVRIVPPSAGSQKEEEASIIAKQLLGKEFNIGVPKREISQNGELPVTAIWALVVVAVVLAGQFVFWGWMYVNDPTGSLSSSSII